MVVAKYYVGCSCHRSGGYSHHWGFVEAGFLSQTDPCRICVRQIGNGTDLSPSTLVFTRVSIISTLLHTN
jgi:hypothetical protein